MDFIIYTCTQKVAGQSWKDCFDLCDILREKLTTYQRSNKHMYERWQVSFYGCICRLNNFLLTRKLSVSFHTVGPSGSKLPLVCVSNHSHKLYNYYNHQIIRGGYTLHDSC